MSDYVKRLFTVHKTCNAPVWRFPVKYIANLSPASRRSFDDGERAHTYILGRSDLRIQACNPEKKDKGGVASARDVLSSSNKIALPPGLSHSVFFSPLTGVHRKGVHRKGIAILVESLSPPALNNYGRPLNIEVH